MKPERRNPFRSSLVIEPMSRRIALAAVATGTYAIAFMPLYHEGGAGASALSLFPVVVLGWLFGAWGGLLAGMFSIPLNALLLAAVGEPGWQIVLGPGVGEGSALVVVVGSVVGLLRDLGLQLDRHLTEWRRAEKRLRATEDRYRLLFERSRDPIYLTTAQGRIYDANDALVRMFGYTKPELLDLDVLKLYERPEDRDRFRQAIGEAGYVEDYPVRLRTKLGEVRDCLITATARFGPEREVIEYQGTIRDVTESRAMEELAERRTAELEEALGELEAFTYSVSHDLRTHLVTIGGFASILWDEHREALGPDGQEFLRRIVEAGRKMDAFVQDMLSYARVSRSELSLEPVALDEVVDSALRALEGAIGDREARIRVEGPLPTVLADRTVLESVVENLVSNAVKFVREGVTPRIAVGAERRDGHVRLRVRDNGIGISETDLSRIFRAFERVDPGRFPGTGVGLSIVQRGAERMGGAVGVSSRPGEGSTFWVDLRAPE